MRLINKYALILVVIVLSTGAVGSVAALQGGATATANSEINVRGGPGEGFWIVDVLAPLETVPIMGVNAQGTWWYVDTGRVTGWVADRVVTAYNTSGVPVVDPGTIIGVTAQELNVRASAGIGAPFLGQVYYGNQMFLLGRNADGSWLNVRSPYGEGWVIAQYTTVGGEAPSVGVPVTAEQPVAIVNAYRLNVRSGPGANYTVLGRVQGGDQLPIIGRSPDGWWFNVETSFGEGWVSVRYVISRDEYGSAPVVTGSTGDFADPMAVINASYLNVRSGPGANYTILGQVRGGEQYVILARNFTFTWALIRTAEFDGWINMRYVYLRGDATYLPVADSSTALTVTDPDTGQETQVQPTVAGPVAFVATGALNIRSGPNVAFEALGYVYAATRMPIIGQSPDLKWWQVESPFGIGWVNKNYVIVEGNAYNVPVVQ